AGREPASETPVGTKSQPAFSGVSGDRVQRKLCLGIQKECSGKRRLERADIHSDSCTHDRGKRCRVTRDLFQLSLVSLELFVRERRVKQRVVNSGYRPLVCSFGPRDAPRVLKNEPVVQSIAGRVPLLASRFAIE